MLIKKNTVLAVKSSRKGNYTGIALKDFDTENDEWYPIAVHQDRPVRGMNNDWENGESIPSRRGGDVVTPIEQ